MNDMCGIVGIIDPGGLDEQELQDFSEMLVRCEERGHAATGAFNDAMDHAKRALPASDFVNTQEFKDFIRKSAGKTWIVGHCRLPSRGSPEDEENNHPVFIEGQEQKAMVVHNGTFYCPAHDKDTSKSDTFIALWITENDDLEGGENLMAAIEKIHGLTRDSPSVFVMGTKDALGFCKSYGKPLVFNTEGNRVAFASTEKILGKEPAREMENSQVHCFTKQGATWEVRDLSEE